MAPDLLAGKAVRLAWWAAGGARGRATLVVLVDGVVRASLAPRHGMTLAPLHQGFVTCLPPPCGLRATINRLGRRRNQRDSARVHLAKGREGCRRRGPRSRGRPGRHPGRSQDGRRHRSDEGRRSVGARPWIAGTEPRRVVHERASTGVLPATRLPRRIVVSNQERQLMRIFVITLLALDRQRPCCTPCGGHRPPHPVWSKAARRPGVRAATLPQRVAAADTRYCFDRSLSASA